MLFQRIKTFYYMHLSLKIGKLDCHFLMKQANVVRLIQTYKLRFESLLDIGCANGLYSIRLSKKFPEVSYLEGFDCSEKSIHYAQSLSKINLGIDSKFYVSNIENTIIENKFDLILFLDCLQYLNNKNFVFQQLISSLKENGHLILYVPPSDRENIRLPKFISNRQPTCNIPYPALTVIDDLFRKHGLKVVELNWVGGKAIRYYMAFKYWLNSYHKTISYFFFPLDIIFAQVDRLPKRYGYGLFFLLKHT